MSNDELKHIVPEHPAEMEYVSQRGWMFYWDKDVRYRTAALKMGDEVHWAAMAGEWRNQGKFTDDPSDLIIAIKHTYNL